MIIYIECRPIMSFCGKGGLNFNLPIITLRPRQNGRHFADDTFKRIFLNENVRISIKISLKFVPKCPINNIPALVQIMAWRRPGDKPLSEPMMIRLLTHICVTQPQWVIQASSGRHGTILNTLIYINKNSIWNYQRIPQGMNMSTSIPRHFK